MEYIPTIVDNEWQTATANGDNNLNGGIHCQEGFRDAVLVLEASTASYSHPKLIHTTLVKADLPLYKLFITQLKRMMKAAGISFEYKGCHELDGLKNEHAHVMWVVDIADTALVFDMADDNSLASIVQARIRRQAPEFYVFVGRLKRHNNQEYIALSAATLQDACCYLSYVYKRRSKPEGHRYLSSRQSGRQANKYQQIM